MACCICRRSDPTPRELIDETQRCVLRRWTSHVGATIDWAHGGCLDQLGLRAAAPAPLFERSVHRKISERVRGVAENSTCDGDLERFQSAVCASVVNYFEMRDAYPEAVAEMMRLARHHASDRFKRWAADARNAATARPPNESTEALRRRTEAEQRRAHGKASAEAGQRLAAERRRREEEERLHREEEERRRREEARQQRREAERRLRESERRLEEKREELADLLRRAEEERQRSLAAELPQYTPAALAWVRTPADRLLVHHNFYYIHRTKTNLSRVVWLDVATGGRTGADVVATPVAVFTELHRLFTEDPGVRRTLDRLRVVSIVRPAAGVVPILYAPPPPRGPSRYTVRYLADRIGRSAPTTAPIFRL